MIFCHVIHAPHMMHASNMGYMGHIHMFHTMKKGMKELCLIFAHNTLNNVKRQSLICYKDGLYKMIVDHKL